MSGNFYSVGVAGTYTIDNKVKSTLRLEVSTYLSTQYSTHTDIGYSLESYVDSVTGKMNGRASAATQEMLNHLPRWMKMRTDPASNGFLVANAAGQHLEHLNEQIQSFQSNLFIGTSEISQLDRLYKIDSADVGRLIQSNLSLSLSYNSNLLMNSDVSLTGPTRTKKAKFWDGNYKLDSAYIYGSNCIRLQNNEYCSQTIDSYFDNNQSLCFSFMYKTDALAASSDENKFGVHIHLIYEDLTRDIFRFPVQSFTDSLWKRESFVVTQSAPVIQIEVKIDRNNSIDFDNAYLNCFQLEIGKSPTSWKRRANDTTIYNTTSQTPSIVAKSANKSYTVELYKDIDGFLNAPATRAVFDTVVDQAVLVDYLSWDRVVDYGRSDWPTFWKVESDQILKENLLVPGEILSRYTIKEQDISTNGFKTFSDVTINYLAICRIDNLLYLLTKDTYQGQSKYYIKVINPFVSLYSKTYLEVFRDIEINLDRYLIDIWTNEYPSGSFSMYVNQLSKNELFIKIPDGSIIKYRLRYDSAYLDAQEYVIYFRENYLEDGMKISLLE